ncbi:uncharacterized protein LOC106174167 [Lingula anatina]|uniref:Uncharacterized protein LOC106174167 n=1 Tax=Lingula anatina TaxID=7574 RepID=A0A2R2MJZ2_LINAN|nr:uncharacterized protein LOC106174167 [Lingula anatina]|eukprot:XP_023930382.1 uncharacterized protein LOC106174167 [Lingula anatina]
MFGAEEDVTLSQLDLIPTQSLYKVEVDAESKRFEEPVHSAEFEKMVADRIPANTQKNTTWACNIFKDWRTWRSLTSVAAGLQRFMRNVCNRRDVWLLKKDDPHFKSLREALEARRKTLFRQGIGTNPSRADPVGVDDEQQLWETGVISTETSSGLSYAVYFYNEKIFGFRARDEHDKLMAEQYSFGQEGGRKYLQYNGRLSKNITGSLSSSATPRIIRHYEDPDNERCLVKLFQKYLSLIPPVGRFYRRPLPGKDGFPLFSSQPVGINLLSGYLPKMFQEAGINMEGRNISGHSGKVTCCTELYKAGFDEQTIKKRSGHSSDAVRIYKRPSLELEQRVSDALQPPRPKPAPAAASSCVSVTSSST